MTNNKQDLDAALDFDLSKVISEHHSIPNYRTKLLPPAVNTNATFALVKF